MERDKLAQDLREQARELLESGRVDCVIGYEAGPSGRARPAFVYEVGDADRLIWDDTCVHNLVTYLHDKKKPARRGEDPPRVAVVVKPCDSRAINVLLAERQIERERLFVIGMAWLRAVLAAVIGCPLCTTF
jgi:formate dehydrogenase subunit beta